MADGTILIPENEEKQRYTRASIICDGCLEVAGRTYVCDILDISAGGAKIATAEEIAHDGELVLQIADLISFPAQVAWRRNCQLGVAFAVPPEAVAEVLPEILQGPARSREQREHLRSAVLWSGEVILGARTLPCRILNVSAAGAKIRLDSELPEGAEVRLACTRFGEVPARVVWREAGKVGLTFLEDPSRVLRAIGNAIAPVRDV